MPAHSKAQYRYMEMIQHNGAKNPSLSKEKAKEFTSGVNYSKLPETVPKPKSMFRRLSKRFSK